MADLSDGEGDTNSEFMPTDGLYSHHALVGVGGGSMDREGGGRGDGAAEGPPVRAVGREAAVAKGAAAKRGGAVGGGPGPRPVPPRPGTGPALPIPSSITGGSDEELERRIGSYVGPRFDGTLGAGGLDDDRLKIKDRRGGAERDLPVAELSSFLREWFDDDKREVIIERVRAAIRGVSAVGETVTRHTALDLLLKNLKHVANSSRALFGPEWIQANIKKRWNIERHPYFVFSKSVQVVTGFVGTNHIMLQAQTHYLPQIKASIEAMSEKLTRAKARAKMMQQLYEAEQKQDAEFLRMRDLVLLVSFPPSGIDLTSRDNYAFDRADIPPAPAPGAGAAAMGGAADEDEDLAGLPPIGDATEDDFLKRLREYLALVHVATIKRQMERGATDGARAEANKRYQGLIRHTYEHFAHIPDSTILNAITGEYSPPWEVPSEPIGIRDLVRDDNLRTELFSTWYDERLKAIGIAPSEYLKGQLNQAYRSFTIGIINTLARGDNPVNGNTSTMRRVDLAITGDLWKFVHYDMQENLTQSGGRQLLRFYDLGGGAPVMNMAEIRGLLENENTQDFAVSITPFTPGTVMEMPSGIKLVQFSEKVESQKPETVQYLNKFYGRLDSTLLNPNNGTWRDIVLNVNWQPDLDRGIVRSPAAGSFTLQAYFEQYAPSLDMFGGSRDERAEFLELFNLIRTGTPLTAVVSHIRKLARPKRGVISSVFYRDPLLRTLGRTERLLTECVQTKRGVATVRGVLNSFPIQYHIDARFTLLLVLLRYEYVRRAVDIAMGLCLTTLRGSIRVAKAASDAAKTASDALEKAKDDNVKSLGELTWQLMPEQTGLISLDPVLSGAVDLAWAWIMQYSRSVPWRNKTVQKLFSSDTVIMNMSEDDPDAFEFKTFLVRVVGMIMTQQNVNHTKLVTNASSAQQMAAGAMNESVLRVKCIQLRIVIRPENGLGNMIVLDERSVVDEYWLAQKDKWSLVFIPKTAAHWH